MTTSLPPPSADALAHSQQLSELIRNDIAAQGGWIPFSRFMELALYAPGLGYYTAGSRKFGEAGDFITAPELSALFGRTVARQLVEVMQASTPHILELGAGSGKLALDILGELERLGQLPESYSILEVSADLRQRQQALLNEKLPHLAARVHWLEALPKTLSGAVIGNEVLDALPVHLLHWCESPVGASLLANAQRDSQSSIRQQAGSYNENAAVVFERGVVNAENGFAWQDLAPENAALLAIAQTISAHFPLSNFPPEGERASESLREFCVNDYLTEVSPASRGLVASLCERMSKGALLFIDYGFGAREYYHPQRNRGTLMCHYRHRAHDDPFYLPGLQDITAHVDFTAIAEAAIDHGAHFLGYTSQAHFLFNNGVMDFLKEVSPDDLKAYLPLSAQLQKLTSPAEMGELFKVIALGKGMEQPLAGFLRGDLSRML